MSGARNEKKDGKDLQWDIIGRGVYTNSYENVKGKTCTSDYLGKLIAMF